MNVSKHLSDKIKKRRLELKLTQREAAKQAGMTQAFISLIEQGDCEISEKSLYGLSYALDVPLSWFSKELKQKVASLDPRSEALYKSLMLAVEEGVQRLGGDPHASVEVSEQRLAEAGQLMKMWQENGLWDIASMPPESRRQIQMGIAEGWQRLSNVTKPKVGAPKKKP